MTARDRFLWRLILWTNRVRLWVRQFAGVHLKGVGFLLRQLKSDTVFEACGYTWYLDHRIAGPYANLVGNSFKEPETIWFLRRVADRADFRLNFVDVGANVGEMVLPMAAHRSVNRVIAFEPHPACAHALRRSLALNSITNTEVREKLIAEGTPQPYVMDEHASPLSGIRSHVQSTSLWPSFRLDDELRDLIGDALLLIDVEGAELKVLKSGHGFIAERQPLIIFEYHDGTAEQFSLDDAREILGVSYSLFRLRDDGLLDHQLTRMLNCVAVSRRSSFWPLIEDLLHSE